MSVLIKGAKVPKSCAECDFIEYDDEYEFECWCPILRINVEEYTAEKYAGCPLVEIPPHGRLIDADKIQAHIRENIALTEEALTCDLTTNARLHIQDYAEMDNIFLEMLGDAPTVIENEEQDNE